MRRIAGGRAGWRRAGRGGRRDTRHRAGPWPVHQEGRTAADCGPTARWPPRSRRQPLTGPRRAYRLFRSQHSAWWQAHAGLVLAQARYAAGLASARLLPRGRPGRRPAGRRLAPPRRRRRICWPGGWRWTSAAADDADRHLTAAARQPAPRPGHVARQRLARRSAAGRGRSPATPPARRLPPRAGRPGRAPATPWAPRSCGPRPPPTAPNWPRSRSAMQREPASPGFCWPGPNAGGPPRWRSPRSGPPPTRSSTTVLPRCGRSPAGCEEARRQGMPTAALQREQLRLEGSVRASVAAGPRSGRPGRQRV